MAKTKRCRYCNRKKKRHLYHADQWKLKVKAPVCKSCRTKHSEAYRQSRDSYYRETYDITLEEYEHLLGLQGGTCAICRRKPGKKRLSVDHDHAVEKVEGVRLSVRGLLCHRCNSFLGHIRDDETRAANVLHYLQQWPAMKYLER